MRSVKRRRPLSRARAAVPDGVDLDVLAATATYVVSAEQWLRRAIAAGHVGAPWSPQPFPQYAWYRTDDVVYEARLTNAEQGAYKGYPLDEFEAPAWLP